MSRIGPEQIGHVLGEPVIEPEGSVVRPLLDKVCRIVPCLDEPVCRMLLNGRFPVLEHEAGSRYVPEIVNHNILRG